MEDVFKRIRFYAILAFVVIIFQSLAGFTSLYTGLFYSRYDDTAAKDALQVIRATDPNYYELLNDSEKPEFMREFKRIHTVRGNMTLIVFGTVMVIMSAMILIPAILIFGSASSQLKEETEEKVETKKEEEEDSF